MVSSLNISLAQLNPIVGDVIGNANMLRSARAEAMQQGSDIVVTGEMFLSGYPTEDLVFKPSFLSHIRRVAEELVAETATGSALIFGLPWCDDGHIYNSVILAEGGHFVIRHKVHLPNASIFDEKRLFTEGYLPDIVTICGVAMGIPICRDIWFDDICLHLKQQGAELLISPNGSPFMLGKHQQRLDHVRHRCRDTALSLIYVNQVGGQDELVFDGSSFVMDARQKICVQMPAWKSLVMTTRWYKSTKGWFCSTKDIVEKEEDIAMLYQATMVGLRDYVRKNRFSKIVLGLSGGIDSAICAMLAVDALGNENVHCVMLPSQYTSPSSIEDATECAKRLKVTLDIISIVNIVKAYENELSPFFDALPPDMTEENIQARIRGTLLMALSNKFDSMLLTTGNKSEIAVGYTTLYGDMNGGYNPIKGLYKTQIFDLVRWRNKHCPSVALGMKGDMIPVEIIEKPPTAELREGQKDDDSLPPYHILDPILMGLVDEELSVDEVIIRGYDREIVEQVEVLLYNSEYKRHQSAIGPNISACGFGRDRRYPITNLFRDICVKG